MMAVCRCCRGTGLEPDDDPISLPDAESLFRALKRSNTVKHIYAYKADAGGWYLTYGKGRTTRAAVMELVRQGRIQSVYSNIPGDCYHIGRTWDCERTLAARKEIGKGAPDYFVGDP